MRCADATEQGAPVQLHLSSLIGADYAKSIYANQTNRSVYALKIIYLDLLPEESLRQLAVIGIAYNGPTETTPFYWMRSYIHQTPNAIWTAESFLPSLAVPSGGWAEITHCPSVGGKDGTTILGGGRDKEGRPMPWLFSSAWAYVAPGSGISINVGRTMVLEPRRQFANALKRAFPDGTLVEGCPTRSSVLNHTNFRGFIHDPELREYDSIQRLNLKEYFSRDTRHEIVLFRYGECSAFDENTPGLRCGRYPHFVPCTRRHFERFTSCTPPGRKPGFSPDVAAHLRGRVVAWSRQNGSRARWS